MEPAQEKQARREMQEIIGRSAMADPAKLKAWLVQSGRRFIVLVAEHLVDALPWPAGVAEFITICEAYRAHRGRVLPPVLKPGVDVLGNVTEELVQETDVLTPEELDRLVHWAADLLKHYDPGWTYEKGLTRTGG